MGDKKILTITLEIEVNEKVTRHSRVNDTYGEVVVAAMEAAHAHMPTDSIDQITTHARWEYRHWDPQADHLPQGRSSGHGAEPTALAVGVQARLRRGAVDDQGAGAVGLEGAQLHRAGRRETDAGARRGDGHLDRLGPRGEDDDEQFTGNRHSRVGRAA